MQRQYVPLFIVVLVLVALLAYHAGAKNTNNDVVIFKQDETIKYHDARVMSTSKCTYIDLRDSK